MGKQFMKLGLAGMGLLFAAMACNFLLSSAKVENVRLAKDAEGASPSTTFGQEDTIYLVGELANAPADTKLKTTWLVVDVLGTSANTVLDEANLETGSGTFNFSLQNNQSLWPAGKYKVDLYMNDELKQSFEYQIEQTVKPEIQSLHLSTEDHGSEPVTAFLPADIWHLVGELTNAPGGGKLRAVWSAVNVEGDLAQGVIDEQNESISNGPFSLVFSGGRSEWPVGSYSVDVYLNDSLVNTIAFQVQSPPEPAQATAPAKGEGPAVDNVYLAKDDQGDNDTNVFAPNDVMYIMFDLMNAPEGAELEAVWMAQEVEGYDQGETLSDPKSFKFEEGSSSISLSKNEGQWTPGKYSVDLKLNGTTVERRDFLVSEIQIIDPYMSYDDAGKDRTSTYGTKQAFFLNIKLANAPSDTKITTKWFQLGATVDQNDKLNESDYNFGTGEYYINLTNNEEAWNTGDYVVDIYLNDYFYSSVYFKVE